MLAMLAMLACFFWASLLVSSIDRLGGTGVSPVLPESAGRMPVPPGSRNPPRDRAEDDGPAETFPWPVFAGGLAGFVLAVALKQLSAAPPGIAATFVGLPLAAACLASLTPWVRRGRLPYWLPASRRRRDARQSAVCRGDGPAGCGRLLLAPLGAGAARPLASLAAPPDRRGGIVATFALARPASAAVILPYFAAKAGSAPRSGNATSRPAAADPTPPPPPRRPGGHQALADGGGVGLPAVAKRSLVRAVDNNSTVGVIAPRRSSERRRPQKLGGSTGRIVGWRGLP